jgi:hypothetical protein
VCADIRNDNLIRICVDNQIGVVSDHNDLALSLGCLEQGNKLVV